MDIGAEKTALISVDIVVRANKLSRTIWTQAAHARHYLIKLIVDTAIYHPRIVRGNV